MVLMMPVAARSQNAEPLALEQEIGADLMLEVVRNEGASVFGRVTFSREQPKPSISPTFSMVLRSGVSNPLCAILPVVNAYRPRDDVTCADITTAVPC